MNWLISRYHPRSIRSMVYMLQSVEYSLAEFFAWYHRADLRAVEYRKTIVWTMKAKALFVAGWSAVILCILLSFLASPYLGVLSTVLAPVIALLGLVVASECARALQKPYEQIALASIQKTLAAHKGTKIAIAGSFGKTTTREILKAVLGAGKVIASPSNSINTPLGIASFVSKLKGDEEVLLFELGEHYPGDIETLATYIQPDIGIITGANEAHLERMGAIDTTVKSLLELQKVLGTKPLYLNAENPQLRLAAASGFIGYGTLICEGWVVEVVESNLQYLDLLFRKGDRRIRAKSKLIGDHLVPTLLLAVVIADTFGLSDSEIIAGIEATKPFAHRLEPQDRGGVLWIDDSYNGNPDGVRAAITLLKKAAGKRRFFVTPGLVEAGSSKESVHKAIGHELADANIEEVVLISNSVTPYIREGLMERHFKGQVQEFSDALEAFRTLPRITVAGDVVLVQNDWPDQYV